MIEDGTEHLHLSKHLHELLIVLVIYIGMLYSIVKHIGTLHTLVQGIPCLLDIACIGITFETLICRWECELIFIYLELDICVITELFKERRTIGIAAQKCSINTVEGTVHLHLVGVDILGRKLGGGVYIQIVGAGCERYTRETG